MRSLMLTFALLAAAACSSAGTPASPNGGATDPTEPTEEGSQTENGETPGSSGGPKKPDPPKPTEPTEPDPPKPSTDAGTDASPPPPPPVTAFTQAEVQTLFTSKCGGCHGASAGLSLSNFTATTVGVASTQVPSMKRITKGDRTKSYLFHKIKGTHLTVGGMGGRMPKSGPPFLSDTEVERVGLYIDSL